MDLRKYPENVKKFISEMIKHGVISEDDIEDEMLINYLYTQRYDEDFIDSMRKDR